MDIGRWHAAHGVVQGVKHGTQTQLSHACVKAAEWVAIAISMFSPLQSALLTFRPSTQKRTAHLDLLRLDACDLQELLTQGELTSVKLISVYLEQIRTYDGYLHAMIDVAPEDKLLELAQRLDEERHNGAVRSRLHGIPIVLKDNIATHPDSGMRTTAGNHALALSKPSSDAKLVEQLLSAGAIVIGKNNMNELSSWKGLGLPSAWSPVGGQGQSAYVRGGFCADDSYAGHSNPGGSSSGSAVAVSAGFAPIAIGTDSEGSLIIPSGRAALYTIKPTIGSVSQHGIVPICHLFDQAGPMAKSVRDVANVLDIIVDKDVVSIPAGGFASCMVRDWTDISVATLDLDIWTFYPAARKPEPAAEWQMRAQQDAAYEKLKVMAKRYHEKAPLKPVSELRSNGKQFIDSLYFATHKRDMAEYLEGLASSPVRSVKEVVEWNAAHPEIELPTGYESQDLLQRSVDFEMTEADYQATLTYCRTVSRTNGLDKIFGDLAVDVLIGPGESSLTQYTSAAGYPIATLPLGQLDFNGRPHALAAVAKPGHEATLIKVMSAWEATIVGPRPVPDLEGNARIARLGIGPELANL